jgi:sulfoxide reductase heme-binding subunit YedZ
MGLSPDMLLRRLVKPLLFAACLVPFVLLVHAALTDGLGANPIETVTHSTGEWTLRLLLVSLAMTPLRRLLGHAWPIRLRRMLGLFAFFYACLHFLAWAWLDQQWLPQAILADIAERPYITVGFIAWLLLIPLALTSTRGSMRRLGRRWKRLHRSVYLVGILGVVHYLWLVKADLLEPIVYAVLLGLLLLSRVTPERQKSRHSVASSPGTR